MCAAFSLLPKLGVYGYSHKLPALLAAVAAAVADVGKFDEATWARLKDKQTKA